MSGFSGNVYAAPLDALAFNGMQINGSCDISQESGTASVVVPSGNTQQYVADGFLSARTGTGAWSVQQVASVFPGYNNELKLTVTTAQATIGTDSGTLGPVIEGYRFQRTMWGTASAVPVTVGCWVKSSVAGSLLLDITNSAFASSGSATFAIAANTPTWCTWLIPGVTTGTWLTTNGIGARVRLNVMNPTTGFNIAATLGNTLECTGWVVLPGAGSLPTASQAPFIMRPYDQELQLCKRYFYNGVPPLKGIVGSATLVLRMSSFHPVPMRAAPTLTVVSPVPVYDGATTGTITSVNANQSTADVAEFDGVTPSSGLVVGRPATIYQGAGGNLAVNARL